VACDKTQTAVKFNAVSKNRCMLVLTTDWYEIQGS